MMNYQTKTKEEIINELLNLQEAHNSLLRLYDMENDESKKAAARLIIANKELAFQNSEKEKRASELAIAVQELAFQNEEKEKRVEELKTVVEELQQFAYVASHDLQEPLRMISSYTQLLERRYKDKLDEDARDFISYAVDGAARMQKLINDLLNYSRVTTHAKSYQQVDISNILGQVIANLQLVIEENSAVITNNVLPVIWAEESQMVQLFQNLIANAIKFRKKTECPIIHISCVRKDNNYEFSIRDNGIGIDMQYQERVFTIFQRLHSVKDYPGTGIGLSINKRIVDRHGGKIWFESNGHDGTTFYFTIPVERAVSD